MPVRQDRRGQEINGSLHSTDASGKVIIPMYDGDGDQRHLDERHLLRMHDASVVAVVSGDTYIFWDRSDIKYNIVAADDTADTLTVLGDLTPRLSAGDTFYVYGSTANDSEYTIVTIAYDHGTNLTTISLTAADLTDGTDDGDIAALYWAVNTATAATNTITITGDVTRYFKVGRIYALYDSTANDGAFTVTAVSYAAATGLTSIVGGAFSDNTDDGYVMLTPTLFLGRTKLRGTYPVNSGHSKRFNEYVVRGSACECPWGVAASGVVDFEYHALLELDIALSTGIGLGGGRVG